MSRPSKRIGQFTPTEDVAITDNQRKILLRLFAGMLEREIAEQSGRKASTIVNTVLRVRARLGARTEYDLMRECIRRSIVTLDEIYALADTIRTSAEQRPRCARLGLLDVRDTRT